MQQTTFVEPGTLAKPKLIGRMVRLLLGVLCCYGALTYGENLRAFLRTNFPPLQLLVGPVVAYWLLPPLVNIGWGVNWKNRSRFFFLMLCGAAIAVDFALYDDFWGPALGGILYAATLYTLGHLGISFLLAALLSTPGCEIRALPDLFGKLLGCARKEHHCPGFIDPIARISHRRVGRRPPFVA